MFNPEEVPVKKIAESSNFFRKLERAVTDAENDISTDLCGVLNRLENSTGFLVKKLIINFEEGGEDYQKDDKEISVRVLLDTDHFSKE